MSLYDDASLVMIPSGYKDGKLYSVKPSDGAGDFTFTRGSNLAATRVDENGLIQKGRENLVLQSNQFDTTWGGAASTLSGQSGYDGSSDAWLITKAGVFDSRRQVITNSGVATFSVYAKAGSYNWMLLHIEDAAGDCLANFDLSTGTLGTLTNGITSKIEDIGSGWYRCSATFNRNLSDVRIYPSESSGYTGSSGSIYIQDAQLEVGLVATDYIETGATTAQAGILEDMPRLDYSGGTCPALLLEPQRTNLMPYSEYFSGWTSKSRIYHTNGVNATTSPDGLSNGWRITGDGTAGQHYVLQSANYTSGTTYTCSIFAKADTHDYIQLILGATPFSSTNYCNYDLSNGTIGTTGSTISNEFIEDYGDGWYRIGFSATAVSTGSGNFFPTLVTSSSASFLESNSTTGAVFLYGGMVEAGSYATSYIPTYGTSVTRGVDATGVTGASSIIGQSEGTIYWEGYIDVSKSNYGYFPRLFSVSSTSLNWVALLLTTSNQLRAQYVVNGSVDVQITHQISTSGNYKIAFAYNDNDFNCFVNGVSVGTNTTTTTTIALNDIYLGMENGQTLAPTSQDTKQAVLFDTRLTNSELAALTTP